MALAMESRGFGALPQRTYYRSTVLGLADLYFVLGCALAFGLIFASRFRQ